MSSAVIFNSFLTLHLIGFSLFAGSLVTDAVTFRQLINYGPGNARPVSDLFARLPALMIIGVLLAVVAGIGMMTIVHGIYGEQVWLRIKVVLVVLAALNGIITRRRDGKKLQLLLTAADNTAAIKKLTGRLRMFYTIQFVLCFGIILLSAFKFN